MINSRVWRVYEEVGSAACATGDFDLAQRMFSAAIATCACDKTLRLERARSLIGLADTHYFRRDIEHAARLYKRVINLAVRFSKGSAPGRLILARALDGLGAVLMQQGRFEESLGLLRRSARILEKSSPADGTALAAVLLRISYINSITGKSVAALSAFGQARSLQASLSGNLPRPVGIASRLPG